VRYPTAGNAYSEEEAQPFYVNAPFGIVLVHNGNLTNAHALKPSCSTTDHRHINTESDSEVLLNVLAHELERHRGPAADAGATCLPAVRAVHRRIGLVCRDRADCRPRLLAFRDPYGIRRCAWAGGADGTE
jgi:amidophosphoribosyltransferase